MLENSICVDDELLVGEILEQVIDLRKEEQEKVVEAKTEDVVVEPDSEMQVLSRVTVKGVTAEIDDSIKPENIKLGATILGVAGNVAPDKPDQSKVVKPSVNKQFVRADTGYELESVEVEGVTSEIDGNIQAENIRYGVEILGVVGAMEQKEDLDAELTEQDAALDALEHEVNVLPIKENIDEDLTAQESLISEIQVQVDNLPEPEIVDLSATTATAEDVLQGKQFYNAQGELVVGGYKDMLQRKVDVTKNCQELFSGITDEDMSWVKKLDTTGVTSMSTMFYNCNKAKTIDVSNFDTSAVKTMYCMFQNCTAVEELDVGNFDTGNVTNIEQMFNGCSTLTNLDLSNLNLNNVTKVVRLFGGCTKLKTINLTNVWLIKATSLNYMFQNCYQLETVLGELDLINITSTNDMLFYCQQIKDITLKNIKISLRLGSGTSYGTLLTNESLINTFKELWDLTGSTSQTLSLSTTSKNNIANIYVKLIDVTDEMRAEDEYIDNKKPCVVCESTDEGAMTLTEYAISKNWSIA